MPKKSEKFSYEQPDGSGYRYVSVTPSDTYVFDASSDTVPNPPRAIYVGTGGDISLVSLDGDTVIFKNVVTGTLLPVYFKQVKATGTTASNLVAIFN